MGNPFPRILPPRRRALNLQDAIFNHIYPGSEANDAGEAFQGLTPTQQVCYGLLADTDGSFRLRTDLLGNHLLRVRHRGVIYQQEVISGVVSKINVFDAVSDLAGVHDAVTVMKIESNGRSLNVTGLQTVTNDSSPPRTMANPRNLEILLPSKSILDSVVVAG